MRGEEQAGSLFHRQRLHFWESVRTQAGEGAAAGPGSPDEIFGRDAAAGGVEDGFGDAVEFQSAFDIGIAHGHGAERSESAGSGGEAERLAEMARFGEHGAISARGGIFPLGTREDGDEENDDGGLAEPPLAIE